MDRLHNPFTPGAGLLPPELAGRASVIEDGRVLAGRTLLGRYGKVFFDVRFDRVSNQERRFLRIMADNEDGQSVSVSDVAARMNRTLSSLSPIRASLIRKGMLYSPSHGKVAYTVPLFGDYMKRMVCL